MTLTPDEIANVAAALDGARRSGRKIPLPAFGSEDLADAYPVQDAVAARHGPVLGWKVGASAPGATPLCAPLLAGTVGAPASRHAWRVPQPIAAEVEIAFVLGRAFPAAGTAPDRDEVLAAIASCHLAIELCATRWEGGEPPPLWKLADNQMNEALLLGPAHQGWRDLDLSALEGRLTVNGAAADTPHRPSTDDLFGLLVWLAGHCVTRRGGLPAGAVVTTGSWTGMHWLDVPATIAGRIGDLPGFEVELSG